MMKDREERFCELPKAEGKLSAIWIAPYNLVRNWLLVGGWNQRNSCQTVYYLGVVRLVMNVSPDGRQISVAPPVDKLPTHCDGVPKPLPHDSEFLIVTVLLSDMHESYLIHEALRRGVQGGRCLQR